MIVEHHTATLTHRHEADETHVYDEYDLMGGIARREAGLCVLCGEWFTLNRNPDTLGLFDIIEEMTS